MIDAVKINIWRNSRGGSQIICATLASPLVGANVGFLVSRRA